MALREVTYLAVILRIVAAVIFGGILGMERGLKNRPAGLRTYMLVCVGSCLIMLTNQYLFQVTSAGDPMRLGAQVVSGIGFLGAGTIIVTKHNQIKGLTTAAGLWAAAGVGLALGVGFYEAAIVAGFAIYAILTLMQYLDRRMHRRARYLELYIEISQELGIGTLIRRLRALNVEIEELQLESGNVPEEGVRGLIVTLKSKKRGEHITLLEKLRKIEGLVYMEEL
ncbi:MAG: MgtC/SapB family protein [Ruminococcaceae bacterium]|nr:MgtC/SapB family protein [Oscillospiraceae bacterium]